MIKGMTYPDESSGGERTIKDRKKQRIYEERGKTKV